MLQKVTGMDNPEHTRGDELERELIKRVLAGERDEFRTLVERHQDTIYALVMRQVGDATVARELSHEAFVKAYRNLSSFRFASSFSTWLVRIAMNTTHSYFSSAHYKARLRNVSLESSPELLDDHSTDSDPTQRAHEREKVQTLRDAIGSLKPIYREVVTLCFLESKTYQEAAQILEIPLGTVCSRLNIAQHKLREKCRRASR